MKRLILFLALVTSASPRLAAADDMKPVPQEQLGGTPDFGPRPRMSYESPQHFAVEIKFTPYTPHIDRSKGLNGQTPFSDLFEPQGSGQNEGKQPPRRLLTTVEFDYQFLRRAYGNFGIAITTGFYRRTTHSFVYGTNAGGDTVACQVPNCTRSGDQTGLNIVPLSAMLVYRLDVLANRYHIPLVPYAKVGIGYYVWWINDGGGLTSTAKFPRPTAANPTPLQTSGYGGSFGIVLNPGIALQLDFIERAAARTMDHELGINHTYLFCELAYANINGFGAKNKLDLSDTTLNAGIGFEF
ncbi:MAG: MXAN_2562 family outer membrane beta-barrel protein [Polyangia bacterium]